MARYKRPGTEPAFHFLTGDQTSIAPLLDTVGYKYQYDPAIDQYAHPAMIAVLTPDGRIVANTSSASTTRRAISASR